MRVLAPAPGVDHEVAEAGAGGDRRDGHRLLAPAAPRGGFDRSGFDNGDQDALRGVLAKNHRGGTRRDPLRHRRTLAGSGEGSAERGKGRRSAAARPRCLRPCPGLGRAAARRSRGCRHLSPPGPVSAAHHRGRRLPVVSVASPPHPSASAATPERILQVRGDPRPWQRPERSSHSVPAPFRSEAGTAGSPGPGDARGRAAAAAAIPPRSQPGPSPRFSRVTFRARAQPITRPGAGVTGSLFPPANRWAGKSAAAPLRAGPEGEAVRLLPSYWAEAGLRAAGEALIGRPRQGRGQAGVGRPGRFGALWLWAGCAGQSRGGAAELARPALKGVSWQWDAGSWLPLPGLGELFLLPCRGPALQRRTDL